MLTLAFFLTNELVQDLFKDNKIYFTYIILHWYSDWYDLQARWKQNAKVKT